MSERDAQERTWEVVRAAFESREPHAPRRPVWPVAVALAAAALAAAALSSPGRALLGEVREAVGVERAEPALFSLPAPGRVLAVTRAGAWVVHADGSKRLLGPYTDAAWSPFGRFVAAARPNELVALEPDGDVRWRLARRGVRLPAWGGTRTDTRIAYLSGAELRVVAGNGRNDESVGTASPVRPAWRPGGEHLLAYVDAGGRIVVGGRRAAALSGARALEWSDDGRRLLALGRRQLRVLDGRGRAVARRTFAVDAVAAAFAPGSHRVAVALADGRVLLDGRTAFTAQGGVDGLAWSPDGRWLALAWREADQLVFVRVEGGRQIRAVANVASQLDGFPRIEGWLPDEA